MNNIEVFKTSDFVLNNPLYTLLLIILFFLFFYSKFDFLNIIKHKLNIQSKEFKIIFFLIVFIIFTLFYLIHLREFKFVILYKVKYQLRFLLFVFAISNPINELYDCVFQKDMRINIPSDEIKDSYQMKLNINNKNRFHVFGIIERLAIGFLILFNAFETIGFILAAKALVREKLIKENDEFAQMYYIGTLYSLVSVFVLWAICFW